MNRPDDSSLDPHQLATVQVHADRLLKQASAHGRFPTPIDDLIAAAKLTVVEDEVLDDNFLRRFLQKTKVSVASLKSALSKILGLFETQDRLVLIDRNTPRPKVPFVKLHEAGHGMLPHQKKAYSLMQDCEKTLDPDITDLFEREANVFASETLFQGEGFAFEAHAYEFGMKVPIQLAKKYGASNYASFRRYVNTNPHACCLIVLEPLIQSEDGASFASVRRVVASKTFNIIYDPGTLSGPVKAGHPLRPLIPRRRMVYPREIVLKDRNFEQRECIGESFDTKHQILVLIRDVGPVKKKSIILPGSSDFNAIRHQLR
ncbi:MAG TPA: ImmA/IrrE family metallo-endopeptidase [Candidatus Angelobacter sp.]|nr:ImmA/IrrE family metallo-endopeptidase [Candidatus Angelobacter sp.]